MKGRHKNIKNTGTHTTQKPLGAFGEVFSVQKNTGENITLEAKVFHEEHFFPHGVEKMLPLLLQKKQVVSGFADISYILSSPERGLVTLVIELNTKDLSNEALVRVLIEELNTWKMRFEDFGKDDLVYVLA